MGSILHRFKAALKGEISAKDLVLGEPFGHVVPPRPKRRLAATDPRTHALRVLRKYIASLEFYRPGAEGEDDIRFVIPEDQIHIEWPDKIDDMILPCIVFNGAGDSDSEKFESTGLVSQIDEKSRDVFGKGTVLQVQYEHTEDLFMEIWAGNRPERRSIIAGLQTALIPTEQMYGIRFRIPDYFNETVCFTPASNSRPDSTEVVRGRRTARMRIEMRFNVVNLVDYTPIRPTVVLNTDVDETGDPLDDVVLEFDL